MQGQFNAPGQGGPNPYAPPQTDQWGQVPMVPEGNYKLGAVLGFLFGFWAMIGCLIFAKEETKRGAKHGFLGRIGFSVVLVLLMVLTGVF